MFADDLQGHRLLSNRSSWFRYTMVSNARWYHDNVVLLGDALRTGHPSVGSGTRHEELLLAPAEGAVVGDLRKKLAAAGSQKDVLALVSGGR